MKIQAICMTGARAKKEGLASKMVISSRSKWTLKIGRYLGGSKESRRQSWSFTASCKWSPFICRLWSTTTRPNYNSFDLEVSTLPEIRYSNHCPSLMCLLKLSSSALNLAFSSLSEARLPFNYYDSVCISSILTDTLLRMASMSISSMFWISCSESSFLEERNSFETYLSSLSTSSGSFPIELLF